MIFVSATRDPITKPFCRNLFASNQIELATPQAIGGMAPKMILVPKGKVMNSLSVAICTYNRAGLLTRVLNSVLIQTLPSGPFEILVVDNGSTDNTRDVVAAYQARQENIRYVEEPIPGIAHARNRAFQQADSEYVAFVDDDAWPEPNWLNELVGTLNSVVPRPACVVGKVLLEWEGVGKPPAWLPLELEGLFCSYDRGPDPRFLTKGEYLLTTNVLFHVPTIMSLGGFRPYLGRKRGQMIGGEDNDIHRRLVRSQHGVFYQPAAVVNHWVSRERQTRWFLVQRVLGDGATQPLMALSEAEETGDKYPVRKKVWGDFRRTLGLALNLLVPPRHSGPMFGRLLTLIQRLGRLRTHFLLMLGKV